MKHVDNIFAILDKIVPRLDVPVVELIESQTRDPFKILVATVLSARTKDGMTAKVCMRLFKKVSKPADLMSLSESDIQNLIYPVGFYKNKATYLKKIPFVLKERFDGIIPTTVDELIQLPGVGRKTANLVVAVAFKKPAICVDIHVHRMSNRLGLVRTKTPYETEMRLRKKLPKKYWLKINNYFVAYGQAICTPVSPWCSKCALQKYCKQIHVTSTR